MPCGAESPLDSLSTTIRIQKRPTNVSDHLKWYALQVTSRQELVIAAQLRLKGFEEFVPLYEVRKRMTNRVKRVSLPIFQGYVFCRIDLTQRVVPVLTTPGIIRIVGAGRSPIPVDESEITSIRRAAGARARLEPHLGITAGRRVRLVQGPLAGCEGVVMAADEGWRLVVSITLLQRSVAVEIESDWVDVIDHDEFRPARRPLTMATAG
jgi:transcription antitermination factor NusG